MGDVNTTVQTVQAVVEKLATMLSPAAHAGWSVAVRVYQINALNNIIEGILCLAITLTIAYSPLWFLKRRKKAIEDGVRNFFTPHDEAMFIPLAAGVVMGLAVSLVPTCELLFNIWNWVGLWDPQLYAAHEVLQHFTSH